MAVLSCCFALLSLLHFTLFHFVFTLLSSALLRINNFEHLIDMRMSLPTDEKSFVCVRVCVCACVCSKCIYPCRHLMRRTTYPYSTSCHLFSPPHFLFSSTPRLQCQVVRHLSGRPGQERQPPHLQLIHPLVLQGVPKGELLRERESVCVCV